MKDGVKDGILNGGLKVTYHADTRYQGQFEPSRSFIRNKDQEYIISTYF
jgi:hypothetical protein